ncbi:MAG: GntR family transcriptional regulator [Rhizobiaceae bacterium]|nr:GntR family transcriptional regulator [Rhizobiaceae bacterium]
MQFNNHFLMYANFRVELHPQSCDFPINEIKEATNCMQSRSAPSSNTEAVTKRLRHLIMTGEISPGDRLTEVGLARLLDVSRTPVRLALARLEQEDLVQGEPHRGFRVRRFTIEEMREIIEVRATLEGMSARLAAERGGFQQYEDEMMRCIAIVDELIARGDGGESARNVFIEVNVRFHATIASMAGNSVLSRRLEESPFRASPLFHAFTDEEAVEGFATSQFDHKRIVEAIRNGEGTRAEFAMREHALVPLGKAELIFRNLHRLSQKTFPGLGESDTESSDDES